MNVVQNQQPDFEDIQPVIDERIVNTVYEIFEAVAQRDPLDDIFENLANRIIENLDANSFMEQDLKLSEEQKDVMRNNIKNLGHETVRIYLAGLNLDERTKLTYGLVREKATEIADALLSAIGQEINRGAVINAQAVQANSKNKAYDEILLRKTKSSGDITVPTSVIVISTNCVDVIKQSCQKEKDCGGEAGTEAAEKPIPEAYDQRYRAGQGAKA
ncbi:MAG: hypothetical protein Pg6C_00500 [Treponemataceae bacterium]|nr:MAG: hypothetical protein Pg6C_00500 [Treponemataceae bacterium]